MTAAAPDDLRERLLRGDLRGLDELESSADFHANPSEWWDPLLACAASLCLHVGVALTDRRREMRPVFDGWQQPEWRELKRAVDPLSRSPLFRASYPLNNRHMIDKYRDRLANAIKAPSALPRPARAAALIDLAHRLLALDPPGGDELRSRLHALERLLGAMA